jgi:hypothetical protein
VAAWITGDDMKPILCRIVSVLFVAMFFAIPSARSAEKNPMIGFPAEFKLSEIWEQVFIDGKPTRVYRFVANESLMDVKLKVSRWLQQAQLPAIEHEKNGWTYISHKKEDTWISVQVRPFSNGGNSSIEGLVSFWQDSSLGSMGNIEPQLATLNNMQVLRRLASVDRGHTAITVTAISEASVDTVANSLANDMKMQGFVPASYAPPSLISGDKASTPYGAVSRAWIGNGRQVLFSVFEHRGKTAAQIYVLRGKNLE